jgi:para-aminobenzoate synthetase component I
MWRTGSRPSASRRRTLVADALELHAVEGAFARVEAWLREHGFFARGGEALEADLYLGYGLSQAIRRERTPPPTEPCPLPLAACSLRPASRPVVPSGFRVGEWRRTWGEEQHAAAVEEIQRAIARGDVYQVNLVQHLAAPFAGDAVSVAVRLRRLRPLVPDPFHGDGWAIVSASPELFLARRGRRVWTAPIKGTRPAGQAAELRESVKDAAEHVMIVDLERNDLSRVCVPGSIRWPELMATRPLAGVEHMVSTVEGELREDVGLADLLAATFPGGSVTGAPKIAAVDHIAALEPVGRGASMGALGRVRGNGDLDLALTIRTFAIAGDAIHLWVGGGIVWDSDPIAEVEESLAKARPLLDSLGAPLPEPSLTRQGRA